MIDVQPTADSLYDELVSLRYYGVGVPLGRLDDEDFPGLIGFTLDAGGNRIGWSTVILVHYAVLAAATNLHPRERCDAAAALFDLNPDPPYHRSRSVTRVPLPVRREAAAALLGYKRSYFERYLEPPLLREMAEVLLALRFPDPKRLQLLAKARRLQHNDCSN